MQRGRLQLLVNDFVVAIVVARLQIEHCIETVVDTLEVRHPTDRDESAARMFLVSSPCIAVFRKSAETATAGSFSPARA